MPEASKPLEQLIITWWWTSRKTKAVWAVVQARLPPSRDPAWVRSCPGSNWSQQFMRRSRMTIQHMFSKPCLRTCAVTWNNLSVRISSTPYLFNFKRTPPYFSPEEQSYTKMGAKRCFRWSSTSLKHSEAGTGQPQNELRTDTSRLIWIRW